MLTAKHLVVLFVGLLLGCREVDDLSPNKPLSLPNYRPFYPQSPFYDTIAANAVVDPHSNQMIQALVAQAQQGFVLAVKEWTVPVYFADAQMPRVDVKLTAGWAPKKWLRDVPIPEWAEPDPEADGHMVVVDTSAGCVYDFWKMRATSRGWKAAWGNALPLDSEGIFPKGLSARGSGFELMQGVVWPWELTQGAIEHALIFSFDHTRAGGPVPPATESDGTTDAIWAIPEGARLQLDPDLDLDSLGLTDYERVLARALQRYGMICADDGGGLQLYAINPICVQGNPWARWWGEQTLVSLARIPAARFRVLKLPPQQYTSPVLVPNNCAQFE